jgi:YD repeat-containing protein
LQSTQDAAGRIQTLTQKLWRPASTSPTATTITQDTQTWTVQYSRAGRITGFTRTTPVNTPADDATFEYDANGNRTGSTRQVAGTTTRRTFTGAASHNRLVGFSQTVTNASGNAATSTVTYQYNGAGDLLGDGLTTYRYDSEGRMESATTGSGANAPTTKYAHNALGQRVFKTEPPSSTPTAVSA